MFGRKHYHYYPLPPLEISKPYSLHVHQGGKQTGIRNQPYFNPYIPSSDWSNTPFIQTGAYPYGGQELNNYSHLDSGYSPFMQYGSPYLSNQPNPAESILQNPLQPKKNYNQGSGGNPYIANNQYPYMHPYPKPGMGNRPPSGVNSIINSFKTQDGSFDINKMVDTAGQMMNAFSQVSGLVKGLGGIFKA